jgi:hypothetical protein
MCVGLERLKPREYGKKGMKNGTKKERTNQTGRNK